MDLVERYVLAVGFWLPRAQRQDIIAELSEDIRSQVEERERDHGAPLGEAEIAALLEQRGHPVLVASRFLPQEYLIGPTLFPVYRFVLKMVAVCYLVPWALVWIGFRSFDPAFRAAHGGSAWFQVVGAFWADFWVAALALLAIVTIIFAAIERSGARTALLSTWDARKLPAVRDPNRIPRSGSILELAIGAAFCVWWVVAMSSPVVLDRPGVRITLAPVWPWFYWGYLALSIAGLALSGLNLMQPVWTRCRAAWRLISDAIGALLFCLLCASSVVAEISVEGVPPAKTLVMTRAVNAWATRAVPVVAAVGFVIAVFDFRRWLRADVPGRAARATIPTP